MRRTAFFSVLILVLCLGWTGKRLPEGEISEVSQSINDFSLSFLKCMAPETADNTVISPYSIFSTLATAYVASGGETLSELATAMRFPDSNDVLAGELNTLRQQLRATGSEPTVRLEIANSMWLDSTFAEFSPEYVAYIQKWFGAETRQATFMKRERAAEEINSWIEEKTKGRVKKGIGPEDLVSRSIPEQDIIDEPGFVAVNTTWFKAAWHMRFDKSETQLRPFHSCKGSQVSRMLMHQRASLQYAENETFKFIELPYANSTYSMYVILPKEVLSAQDMLSKVDIETVDELRQHAFQREVDVLLPRFEVRTHCRAKDVLTKMGVRKAWSNQLADFDRMIIKKDEAFRIYLSEVYNDSWMQTDEDGTEAASVTSMVGYSFGCSVPAGRLQAEFHADHPFVFLVVHNESRSVLFAGWITDPGIDGQ